MGYVFDEETAEAFDWWRRTAEGQYALEQECETIRRILRPQIGDSILDVGSGPGFHLKIFKEWNMRPAGIDASPTMVDFSKQRLGFRIPVLQGFAERLPFPDGHFDVVIFNTSLEFVDSPDRALREAVRVARKKVVLVILNGYSWFVLSRKIDGLMGNDLYRKAHFFSLWKLKKMIRRQASASKIRWASNRIVKGFQSGSEEGARNMRSFDSPFARYIAVCVDLAVPVRQKEWVLSRKLAGNATSWAQRSSRVHL
jgi:ubiquinone/menaquinone biosynthesis C-methylase UbiE